MIFCFVRESELLLTSHQTLEADILAKQLTLEELTEVWAAPTGKFISNEIHYKVPAFWKRTAYNTKVMTPYFFKRFIFFQRSAQRPATIPGPPINSYGADVKVDHGKA